MRVNSYSLTTTIVDGSRVDGAGYVSESVICSVCGGTGVVHRASGIGTEQSFSDRDQTASDHDQTGSDHDQTSSERDQRSAADDQKASDADVAAGGDPIAHEESRLARELARDVRHDVARQRDQTGADRSETARLRDRAAELRDQDADTRDRFEREGPSRRYAADEDVLLRAERDRAIAAADRARAADDRAKAAADREDASRQRQEAFLAQAEARQDLLAAATDELTGAFTRKFGLENLSRELERARRTDDSLTLAFIDVDRLKEVNDKYGHPNGDQLLTRVVDTVRANVRSYDMIVRYGGDEFLCALPHLSRAVAGERMEKIAAILSALDPDHSIAYGLAESDSGDGVDSLIGRADAELLAAKRAHNSRD